MKVAINLTREKVGGITSSNINLINYLYKSNYEFIGLELASRMHMEGPALFRSFAPEIFNHHIISTHHLPLDKILRRAGSLAEFKKAYREPIKILRKILQENRPDVVLISGTYYLPWLISIAAKKEKIPVVLWYSGVLSKESEHRSAKIRTMFLWVEKAIINNASKVVFPSELCKKTVEEIVTKRRVKKGYVIPNPMASIFTDPSVVDDSSDRKIAAVGRYSRIKNFDKFFELHAELQKRNWRHTASFVTNPDANLERMPKSIQVFPSMKSDELKNFYLSQGLVVCPSIFETFGNVPMEAACLGIPVLVSDQMGCAEILKKVGLANMVISFDDMAKVADRVEQLCDQSILPTQLNALKKILDTNVVSEQIKKILEEVAKR
ncbi:MAG TPA: glycosyltransferase [Negativicutes bacterium]|nr:glycosyltransferase [Negativicutes bacterium]